MITTGAERLPRPLCILVVTAMYPHPERPSQGTFVQEQVERLRAIGHRVDVYHFKGYRSKWRYVRAVAAVFARTLKTRYDVVHAHFGLTGLAAMLRWRAPLVLTLHGSDVLRGGLDLRLSKLSSRIAARTISVSPQIARIVPSEIIPCGVDLEKFVPLDRDVARNLCAVGMSEHVVLFPFDPSRPEKRAGLAGAAVGLLRERMPTARLMVVHGVRHAEMVPYYSAANTLLVASTHEGSSTSIKEALACNISIVSTAVGDAPEVLDGLTHARVADASEEALAAALFEVGSLPRPTDVESRAHAARFSAEEAARRVEAVYREVVGPG